MTVKLILVEGLPGQGKTTTARLIHEILMERNVPAKLYLEGDLDHPADYDGVSCLTEDEFKQLLGTSGPLSEIVQHRTLQQGDDFLVPYRIIERESGGAFPPEALEILHPRDIYELPLDRNEELIVNKWAKFAEKADKEDAVYIFDCCFIQNPITIGFVKYGAPKDQIIRYITRLSEVASPLDPVLFYVEQDDLESTFKKAMLERPAEWASGFIDYYTTQGYGKQMGYSGLDGTLKVLQARRDTELKILEGLAITKRVIHNGKSNLDDYKELLTRQLGVTKVL